MYEALRTKAQIVEKQFEFFSQVTCDHLYGQPPPVWSRLARRQGFPSPFLQE